MKINSLRTRVHNKSNNDLVESKKKKKLQEGGLQPKQLKYKFVRKLN
jgi:hypothetical protein